VRRARTIAVVTGSRADYGLQYWLIRALHDAPDLTLQLVVTGSHLAEAFGRTVDQVRADGMPVAAEVPMIATDDSEWAMARSTGEGVIGMADAFKRLQPDLVVLPGDRFEILAAAQAAMLMGIPVAHLHGGEVTEGAIDESIRHAVSKMSSIHFVSAEPYRQRLIRMGEDPVRVHVVGAPGLDHLTRTTLPSRDELLGSVGLDATKPFLLVTYHPATRGDASPLEAVQQLTNALDRFPDHQLLITKANADAGGRAINNALDTYAAAHRPRAALVASLGTPRYLSAVTHAAALVGNSSSALIEAPAAGTPTVNIGPRQQGRLRAASVVDCDEHADAIAGALTRVLRSGFREQAAASEPPYGRPGDAASRMLSVLRGVDLDQLRIKKFHDEIRLKADTTEIRLKADTTESKAGTTGSAS
jgi:UDP-hydrolysing UDP-N-acetyl-D-glucosamine 2-epimerase